MEFSKAYKTGFMDKLAAYEKTAKFRYEMSPEEKMEADRAFASMEKERLSKVPRRNPKDKDPKTLVDWIGHVGKKTGRKAISLGRGALSAAGVTGVRAIEGLSDLALWIPELVDSIAFGRIAGVDGGRGFLGRALSKGHRFADSTVHKLRRWSEDYDYANRIDSGFNRFIQGVGADAIGTFIGWGGLAGVGKKGLTKLIAPAFGTVGAAGTLMDGQQKQLRKREEMLRGIDPRYVQYFDPTSTAYNRENAPTLAEFKHHHLPSTDLPTSHTGKIRIPRSWRYQDDGSPTQFIDYGED